MRLGYNTNGLAHHDILAALKLLAEIGYERVALTIDHHVMSPSAESGRRQVAELGDLLQQLGLRSVIETGGRYLLDPRTKHEPTLVTADAEARQRRVDFYRYAIDVAATLGSDCVSLWSGKLRVDVPDETAFGWLIEGLRQVLDYADAKGVVIGFEPEPGMFVDTMARYGELVERIDAPELKLTFDVGHVHCQDEGPLAEVVRRWSDRLANVHIEDMRRGVHEHLMFGDGEIDFPPILAAFEEVGYTGGLYVELSRHSHEGPEAARRAYEFLRPMIVGDRGDG